MTADASSAAAIDGASTGRSARLFARFVAVGVLNTAVGYALYILFWRLSDLPVAALALATIIGVAFNFVSNGRLVFNDTDRSRIWRFAAVYALVFTVNALLLSARHRIDLDPALAQAALIVPMALLSFFLQRRFVFGASS